MNGPWTTLSDAARSIFQQGGYTMLLIGAVSAPIGLWVFRRGEIYAKKHGKLKRSG